MKNNFLEKTMTKINISKMKSNQHGASFLSMLFVAAIVGVLFILGAKVTPAVIEYQSILKAVNTVKGEATVADVRRAFDRNAATSYFEAISGKDLVVDKVADKNIVSFAYNKEIELVAPVYLLLKFTGKTN
jgi:Tfp pilus assembly protein PilE